MSAIGADTDQLRDVARKMRAAAETIHDEIGGIDEAFAALSSGWTGQAQNRFAGLWEQLGPNYPTAADYLDRFARQLDTLADKLDEEEGGGGVFGFIKKAIKSIASVVGSVLSTLGAIGNFVFPGASLLKMIPAVLDGDFTKLISGLPGAGQLGGMDPTSMLGTLIGGADGGSGHAPSPGGFQYAVSDRAAGAATEGSASFLGADVSGRASYSAGEVGASAWVDPEGQAAGASASATAFRASAEGRIDGEHFDAYGRAEVEGPSASAEVGASWDPENPYVRGTTEVSTGRASAEGSFSTDLGSIGGHAEAEGPAAGAGFNLSPEQMEARVGASAGTARAGGSFEFLGQEMSAGVEVGLKAELGVSFGEKTAIHLPFISLEAGGGLENLVPGMNQLAGFAEGIDALKDIGGEVVDLFDSIF